MVMIVTGCGSARKQPTLPDTLLTSYEKSITYQQFNHSYSVDTMNSAPSLVKNIPEAYFDTLEFGEEIIVDTSKRIAKKDGVLRLPLDSGKELVLKDAGDNSNDDYVHYYYEGEFKSINYYLIATEGYETIEYNLIDKENGKEYSSSRNLFLSPQHNMLLEIEDLYDVAFLEAPYLAVSFRRVLAGKISEEFSAVTIFIKPVSVEPLIFPKEEYEVRWENDTTVALKLSYNVKDGIYVEDYIRVQLK